MDSEIIIKWLEELPLLGIYVFLFFSSLLENLFPPWPGDTFIVLGGFLAAQNKGTLSFYFLSTLLGNLAGAALMYYAGEHLIAFFRFLHDKTQQAWLRRILKPLFQTEQIKKAEHYFKKWGAVLVLFSRFSAGIRFFVSIAAGMVRMNFPLFIICFALGVLAWNSLLLWGGWQLKTSWNEMLAWLQLYNTLVMALILALLLLWLLYKKRKQKSSEEKSKS